MIRAIRNALRERVQRAANARKLAGYDYAAGSLLLMRASHPGGEAVTMQRLEAESDASGIAPNEFDAGIRAALADWYQMANSYTSNNQET